MIIELTAEERKLYEKWVELMEKAAVSDDTTEEEARSIREGIRTKMGIDEDTELKLVKYHIFGISNKMAEMRSEMSETLYGKNLKWALTKRLAILAVCTAFIVVNVVATIQGINYSETEGLTDIMKYAIDGSIRAHTGYLLFWTIMGFIHVQGLTGILLSLKAEWLERRMKAALTPEEK